MFSCIKENHQFPFKLAKFELLPEDLSVTWAEVFVHTMRPQDWFTSLDLCIAYISREHTKSGISISNCYLLVGESLFSQNQNDTKLELYPKKQALFHAIACCCISPLFFPCISSFLSLFISPERSLWSTWLNWQIRCIVLFCIGVNTVFQSIISLDFTLLTLCSM